MTDTRSLHRAIAAPRFRKWVLVAALLLLLIGAAGFFVLSPVVKSILVDKLAQALHRPVTVERVSINPYTLSVELDGLAIQEKGGGDKVAGFERLYANVEVSSLFRGGLVISELTLVGPTFRIVRLADGQFNFSDLIDEFMNKPPSNEPTPPFSLNNIRISGGAIDFDDRLLNEKHSISDLHLALPFISSLPTATDIFVVPAFSAMIDGSPLVIQGRSKPFAQTQASELSFELRAVKLGAYLDYLPIRLPVSTLAATLDGDLKLDFQRHDHGQAALTLSGKIVVSDVAVQDSAGAPLLSLRRLEVVADHIDPLGRKYAIERVALDSPEIHARVNRQGEINWITFFSQQLAAAGATAPAPQEATPTQWSLGEATVSGGSLRWVDESHGQPFNAGVEQLALAVHQLDSRGTAPARFAAAWHLEAGEWITGANISIKGGTLDLAKREVVIEEVSAQGSQLLVRRAANGSVEFVPPPQLKVVEAAQRDSAGPWKVTLVKYRADGVGVRFEDRAVSPLATHTIAGMNIDVGNLSTEPGKTASVSVRGKLNRKGELEAIGSVRLQPLAVDLKVAAKALELLPLQPYFTERLNIELTRGQITVDGSLQLRQTGSGPSGPLNGGFAGQVTVGDFHAIDKVNAADFLKWKSLYLGRIDLRLNPTSLSVDEVALADFFARVIVSREGKLNLLQIVRQAAPEAAVTASREGVAAGDGQAVAPISGRDRSAVPVKVGKITLQGGDIRFTDNFIKPNYSARLQRIGGSVSGLSSTAGSLASLDLRGSYDNVAPLVVTAKLNPLAASPYLDLEADVKGIEMTSLSPYSGKYAGYAIEKGKLSLFVKYKIENNQLAAENRVFLDQLTFGEAVDSPDATKLPVTLAVALLKNRNGEIDVNLPIAGSLDDPEFSVGGLVLKVIVNLLMKAVTSPFALLGSVFGGGEELSSVDFDVGQAVLSPAAQQRLDKLAKALLDRPALKLEIEGRADPELDPEGLKRDRLQARVRALKRGEMSQQGVDTESADAVEVSAKEYPALLERVYRSAKFPKPRNLVGMVKGLPVEEMEKLIISHSPVDEDDLRELADRRAKATREALLARGVGAERLFLLPVKLVKGEGRADAGDQARAGQVVFALK